MMKTTELEKMIREVLSVPFFIPVNITERSALCEEDLSVNSNHEIYTDIRISEGKASSLFTLEKPASEITGDDILHLKELVEGYKRIVSTIYTPKYYYFRIRDFLKEYNPQGSGRNFFRFKPVHILTLFKTTFFLGIIGKERLYYWKLMLWTIFRHPGFFPVATTLAIYGFHHRKVSERYVAG